MRTLASRLPAPIKRPLVAVYLAAERALTQPPAPPEPVAPEEPEPLPPEPELPTDRLFSSYDEALAAAENSSGYDEAGLSDFLARKHREYLRRGAVDHDLQDHESHTLLSAMLSGSGSALNVLDFGGATGLAFHRFQRFCPDRRVIWNVIEVPSLAERMTDIHPDLRFSSDLAGTIDKDGPFDLVHASGALQCVSDPRGVLDALLAAKAQHMFFGRTMFSEEDRDVIFLHKTKIAYHGLALEDFEAPEGEIDYPFTLIPRREFLDRMKAAGYELVSRFRSLSGRPPISSVEISDGAYLFRRVGLAGLAVILEFLIPGTPLDLSFES